MIKGLFLFLLVGITLTTTLATTQECALICPLIYSPICAQDSTGNVQTFGNRCAYDAQVCRNPSRGYRILKEGAC